MKTAASYHRVSTADQDATLARDELRAAASARRLQIAWQIEETGSGARNDRPGLQQILDLARRGKIAFVLVWKLDRFGRSVVDVVSNVKELVRCGVTFVSITQGIEIGPESGPAGNLVLSVLAAAAEFEREVIRERIRLGLSKARKRGVKLGRRQVVSHDAIGAAYRLRAGGATWGQVRRQVAESGHGHYTRTALERAVNRERKGNDG